MLCCWYSFWATLVHPWRGQCSQLAGRRSDSSRKPMNVYANSCHSSLTTSRFTYVYYSVSLRFNGHFPGGPGLPGTRLSPFWILLELRMMEVVVIRRLTQSLSSFPNYHLNLLFLIIKLTGSNPKSSLSSSLFFLSCSLTPHIHLIILISVWFIFTARRYA